MRTGRPVGIGAVPCLKDSSVVAINKQGRQRSTTGRIHSFDHNGFNSSVIFLTYLTERIETAVTVFFFLFKLALPVVCYLTCKVSFEKQTAQPSKLIYLALLML